MKKKILTIILAAIITLAVVFPLVGFTTEVEAMAVNEVPEIVTTTTSEAYIPSDLSLEDEEPEVILDPTEYTRIESKDMPVLQTELAKCEERMTHAHELAQSGRKLGYPEDHPVIELAKNEWTSAQSDYNYYNSLIEEIKKEEQDKKKSEYENASYIWYYMKDLGWNDYVCAGIMGNIMAEVGGQTLNIQYTLGGRNYYGMCQWSKKYYPEVIGADLEGQCDYLRDTIKAQFDAFGPTFGYSMDKFYKIDDERVAAKVFAQVYERCSSKSYYQRQENATNAYNYFVG